MEEACRSAWHRPAGCFPSVFPMWFPHTVSTLHLPTAFFLVRSLLGRSARRLPTQGERACVPHRCVKAKL
jgi:hypothetical protein